MEFLEDQLEELKTIYPNVKMTKEGEKSYFLLPDLDMPEGCIPKKLDALLCPFERDGYHTTLFFSQQITGCPVRNWNRIDRILDRTWYAISWNFNSNRRLVQIIRSHLDAFRK